MRKLILSTPKADATQTLFLQSQNTLWDNAAKFSTDEPKNNLDQMYSLFPGVSSAVLPKPTLFLPMSNW